MESTDPGQTGDENAELRTAPDHIVDLLLGIMRPPARAGVEPGSVTHARAARAEAKYYADRIWGEAAHAGATWGLARNTNLRIEVTAERLAELTREAG